MGVPAGLWSRGRGHFDSLASRPVPVALAAPSFIQGSYGCVEGDRVALAVHAPEGAFLVARRMGQVLGHPRRVAIAGPHSQDPRFDRWAGCDWRWNVELDTTGWEPGFHLLRAEAGTACWSGALLVRRRRPAAVALIGSTHTWDTYNAFGGLSNYQDQQSPFPLNLACVLARVARVRIPTLGDRYPIIPLPRARPNARIDLDLSAISDDPDAPFSSHLARAEWPTFAWFEREGIEADGYDQAAWDRGDVQQGCRLFVFHAHSEYWTRRGLDRLVSTLRSGASVLFLSGNNLWQFLEPYEGGLRVGRLIDPFLGRSLLGTAYKRGTLETSAPYALSWAEHPLLSGSGAANGASFGTASRNLLGASHGPAGASAHEFDVEGPGGEGFQRLAEGTNDGGGAALVARRNGEGWVVNTSSTGSTGSLLSDGVLGTLVRNLCRSALGTAGAAGSPRPPMEHPPGASPP